MNVRKLKGRWVIGNGDHNALSSVKMWKIKLEKGRSGGLVVPSLSEFSTIYCDPHSQRLGIVNKALIIPFFIC